MDTSELETWLQPSEEVGLNNCDREPIHVPSAIQPHGALLVLNDRAEVLQASANVEEYTSRDTVSTAAELREHLHHGSDEHRKVLTRTIGNERVTLISHRVDTLHVVELEPASDGCSYDLLNSVNQAISSLSGLSLTETFERVVAVVQSITGYDRVLGYRFSKAGHGEVIAESAADGTSRFLGLRFPSTDIPKQARRLYTIELTRQIVNVAATPAPLHPIINPRTGRPLNMAHCQLRAVSPIHIQYLRNMELGASFSVSIVVDGKLEALIACHHGAAKFLPLSVRQACELIGRAASAHLSRLTLERRRAARGRVLTAQLDLVSELAEAPTIDIESQAWEGAANLVSSHAALVSIGDDRRVVGDTPACVDHLWEVGRRIATEEHVRDRAISALDTLDPDCAGGLLVVPLPLQGWLGWYRAPSDEIIHWAGKPEDDGEIKTLTPRSSFEIWKETVSGRGEEWTDHDLEIAEVLRRGMLARFGGLHTSANKDSFERTLKQLREYIYDLEKSQISQRHINDDLRQFAHAASHDLRAPLRTIRCFLPLIREQLESSFSDQQHTWFRYVESAANTLARLQDGLWAFSRVGGSDQCTEFRVGGVVQRVVDGLAADLQDATVTIGELPEIVAVKSQVETLFRNLIDNAAKYRSADRALQIVVDARGQGDDVVFSVGDNGIGFPPSGAERMFDLFSRLHPDRGQGDGLGLALCRRIVHHHNGWIRASSEGIHGSTFEFALRQPESP